MAAFDTLMNTSKKAGRNASIVAPTVDMVGGGRLFNLLQLLLESSDETLEALLSFGLVSVLISLRSPFKAAVRNEVLPLSLSFCQKHSTRLRLMIQQETYPAAQVRVDFNLLFYAFFQRYCLIVFYLQALVMKEALKYSVSPDGIACVASARQAT